MNEPSIPTAGAMTPGGAPLLLNLVEAADALRISRWQLYQLINDRRLNTVKIGRRRFVIPGDLYALVDQLRNEGGE
jgi:excisionase family DNA binding protein